MIHSYGAHETTMQSVNIALWPQPMNDGEIIKNLNYHDPRVSDGIAHRIRLLTAECAKDYWAGL